MGSGERANAHARRDGASPTGRAGPSRYANHCVREHTMIVVDIGRVDIGRRRRWSSSTLVVVDVGRRRHWSSSTL